MPFDDVNIFFADFGVSVAYGATQAKALFDLPTETLSGGVVISTDYSITFATGSLPGLKHGDQITIKGGQYRVREVHTKDDGNISEAFLSKLP